jgi:hypothetical protein
MGRRIRLQQKKAIHFVTNRWFQQRFSFRPSNQVNRIILGCLNRAAAKHHVRRSPSPIRRIVPFETLNLASGAHDNDPAA